MHTGSCLCGGVRFEIDGDLAAIQICHCADCRKAQGAAFGANIPVNAAAFRLLAGQSLLKAFHASPGKARVFCRDCGSPIYSRLDAAPTTLRVRAGLLESPVASRPVSHAFTKSKADWWAITDSLPQFPEKRPA